MRFELKDRDLLVLNGISCCAYAAHAIGAPSHLHKMYMSEGQPCSESAWKWFGQALVCKGATDFVITASEPNKKVLKNSLKANGLINLASSAHLTYSATQSKTMKADAALASAAGLGVLGGLCLWRGFQDE